MRRLGSVRTRLLLLFFAITAGAVGFVYLYVVPQLSSSLTAEKLRNLKAVSAQQGDRLAGAIDAPPSQAKLQGIVQRLSLRADARVTLLGVRSQPIGPRPAFVVADSGLERDSLLPGYPAASIAVATGGVGTAVERVSGERLGETAVALAAGGAPRWVAVFSTPLGDVDDNVSLIKRQILIAGAIALAAALAAGWLAARAHSRRLLLLEAAAEKVADGDLATPIPVDSTDEVGQLAGTLNEMRERLARLDSARKEFIANASHELRTPIFSLGGFVELLEDEDPDPEVRAEFVRTMRGQIDRLTKLTTDLLDLSKLDADALQLRAGPIEIGETARRVASEFAPAAEGHRSPIRIAGGEAFASADADRVAQIIRILLDNALTHTPEGTAITVTTSQRRQDCLLAVRDDGPGIEPRSRPRVFDRFFTGDEVSGSGLGLAIARELARLMNGELDLDARGGRTEFTLRLPAAAIRASS